MSDENYESVLLEKIHDQNQLILEAVSVLAVEVRKKSNQSDVDEIKQDVKLIKHVLRGTNQRVTKLETA